MKPTRLVSLATLAAVTALATAAHADRIKDLSSIQGVRSNQLTGFGIVVGLDGTGDETRSPIVRTSITKMLKQLGASIDPNDLKAKNVAAVVITAELPPFARPGEEIDITVSSVGTAKSLAGGTLVASPLRGPDGKVWALAQGALTVGGYAATGGTGSESRKNHVTVGRIPNGATVEGNAPTPLPKDEVVLILDQPDFTTADRMAQAIVAVVGPDAARVRDAGAVVVAVGKYKGKVPQLIAQLEAIEVAPDVVAKVVIDERTGTIVVGDHVHLGAAAIAYGGLTVEIKEQPIVSQPGGIANRGATTTVVPHTDINVNESAGDLHPIAGAATVGEVAAALNALGAKPRDLVAILQALKAAGALRGELEVL
jgi:flagellar P-ring protein FlgI